MKIIRFESDRFEAEKSAVTIGTYDGVHRGHKSIVERLKAVAKPAGLIVTVITFEPHPRNVLSRKDNVTVPLLSVGDEKAVLLDKQGVERLVIIPFNAHFSQMDYRDFLNDILLKKLKMQALVIGYNHTFGKGKAGNYDSLKPIAVEKDFYLEKVEPLYVEGEKISSTKTRRCLENGDVESAMQMLGHAYSLSGKVVKGDGRGKSLTFPTANIDVPYEDKLIPAHGVYAVDAEVARKRYPAMMNIGLRPTFAAGNAALETHIFGLNKNLYGQEIKIYFKKRLRDERKFNSREELMEQLNKDKEISLSCNILEEKWL